MVSAKLSVLNIKYKSTVHLKLPVNVHESKDLWKIYSLSPEEKTFYLKYLPTCVVECGFGSQGHFEITVRTEKKL